MAENATNRFDSDLKPQPVATDNRREMNAESPVRPVALPGAVADTPTLASPEAWWLDAGDGAFLAFLHRARRDAPVGVLLVPPFGWDNMASYGPRHHWANHLAAHGHPVVRCDLPATSDSAGGPWTEAMLPSWVAAVSAAAEHLREQSGCRSVVALGLSVGGLIALSAAAQGAPIDHFVLWATSARGAEYERELRAFSRLEQSRLPPEERDSNRGDLREGDLIAGGYLVSAETRAAIKALDASALTLPESHARHALLLGRGRRPDEALQQSLTAQGVTVRVGDGDGYNDLLVEPQLARLPDAIRGEVDAFLTALPESAAVTRAAGAVAYTATQEATAIETDDGASVHEALWWIDYRGARQFGILASLKRDPHGTTGAILIGGTGHRIGPNRMWTEMARRWAARGVPTLRIDLAGAGDAETVQPAAVAGLYTSDCVEQTLDAIDAFRAQTGVEKVIVLGLCASAFWAAHAALERPEVVPVALNLPFMVWNQVETSKHSGRLYRGKLRQGRTLRRALTGEIDLGRALSRVPDMLNLSQFFGSRNRPPVVTTPTEVLDALDARKLHAWFVFAGAEPLGTDMQPGGGLDLTRWPNLRLDAFGSHSDLHTLRPLWVQNMLHARVDRILEAELPAAAVASDG